MQEKKATNTTLADLGLLRIRHVRFPILGMMIASAREAADHVVARASSEPRGYDIFYSGARRSFRFDYFDGGRYVVTKWIPIEHVATYEEWDKTAPVFPQSSSAE